jgi:hypothetical protein
MNTLKINLLILLLSGILGCGTTAEITYSYVDPDASKKDLAGVLVIGVATTNEDRIDFEKAFTRVLKREGVRAVSSYTLVPGEDVTAEQAIAAAKKNNLDTVLVTRYVGEMQEEIYHPGTVYYGVAPRYGARGSGFGGYYGQAYEMAYDPAVYTTNTTVVLVSDLFEVSTEDPLWQVVSEAIKAGSTDDLRDAFIATFVNELKAQKLIR